MTRALSLPGALALLMHLPVQTSRTGRAGILHIFNDRSNYDTAPDAGRAFTPDRGRPGIQRGRLRFDGRFIVDLEVTDDEDAIYLYARLGTLPAGEQGRELMARMMRAHCLGRESGNTLFGLDGEEIMVFARVAAAEAGEGTLFTALEDFLDVLAHWADVMQQGR